MRNGADFAAPAGKKALGRPRVVPLRGVIDALLYFFGRRVRGVCRRAIFRSARPCNVTFMPGRPKGYWKRSISCWSNRLGSAMAAKPARRQRCQSAKTTESGGPRGYDAGRRSTGASATSLPIPPGHLVGAQVHRAYIQDRDGAGFDPLPLPMAAPSLRPSRGQAFADGAYARATSWRQRLPGAGSGRWSSDPTRPKVFKYCPGDGSSSGPSPGLDAIAG